MSKDPLNKELANASGVLLIHQGKIIDFFPQSGFGIKKLDKDRRYVVIGSVTTGDPDKPEDQGDVQIDFSRLIADTERSMTKTVLGNRIKTDSAIDGSLSFLEVDFDSEHSSQLDSIELNEILEDFSARRKEHYQKIEASQNDIKKLNAKSADRQKRFERAMQKLEDLLPDG